MKIVNYVAFALLIIEEYYTALSEYVPCTSSVESIEKELSGMGRKALGFI